MQLTGTDILDALVKRELLVRTPPELVDHLRPRDNDQPLVERGHLERGIVELSDKAHVSLRTARGYSRIADTYPVVALVNKLLAIAHEVECGQVRQARGRRTAESWNLREL